MAVLSLKVSERIVKHLFPSIVVDCVAATPGRSKSLPMSFAVDLSGSNRALRASFSVLG